MPTLTQLDLQTYALIVAATALVVNFVFVILRYYHDKATRNIAVSARLIDQWVKLRAEKTYIASRLHTDYPPGLGVYGYSNLDKSPEHRDQVVAVSYLCDEIAARAIFKEANEQYIISFIGTRMLEMWEALEPYIKVEREHRQFPLFQAYFEVFAARIRKSNPDRLIKSNLRGYKRFKGIKLQLLRL